MYVQVRKNEQNGINSQNCVDPDIKQSNPRQKYLLLYFRRNQDLYVYLARFNRRNIPYSRL